MAASPRELWRLLELVHGGVYFAPDARERFDAVELRGFWMGYFASRSAAMGAVGPEVVTASFYVFNPAMVARAIPDAWSSASPEAVLAARAGLADDTLRRALAAAHAAVPQPAEPLARLWWAATVLREHRGDGHVAALLTAGVGPCEALVLGAATGSYGPGGGALLRRSRQWSDDDWAAASDRLAAEAYAPASDGDLDRLAAALTPVTAAIAAAKALPFPNPIGVAV